MQPTKSNARNDPEWNPQLAAAVDGGRWSLAGVLTGLVSLIDDEGRPIGERRAPAEVKERATMELRACPYRDERYGRSMNVSALEQITQYFDATLEDLARFRVSTRNDPPRWQDVYAAMIDQMVGPAVHLLRARDPELLVPAKLAVGYKVLAGFSTPLRHMLELEAAGRAPEVAETAILATVADKKLLIGAGEVCAGPPVMISKVTAVLVHGADGDHSPATADRIAIARRLTLQTRVGILWQMFDVACERALLLDAIGKTALRPRNKHLTRLLDERTAELDALPNEWPDRLPSGLSDPQVETLGHALHPDRTRESTDTANLVTELLDSEEGAIEIDARARKPFGSLFSAYLTAYRGVAGVLQELELGHRRDLGYKADLPFALSSAIFPKPRALNWFERILGYRLRPDGARELAVLKSQEQTVPI